MARGADRPAPDHARERDPGVGLDQGQVGRQQPGDRRGARDAVRLGGDEAAQRRREQPVRLGDDGRRRAPSRGSSGSPWSRPTAHRRPWLKRSRNGPISGATIANGQHRQAEEQRDLAARLARSGTWKNRVPASEIATAASPAALKAWSSISRESPESPAPSARVARRVCATANCPAVPAPRPAAAGSARSPGERTSYGACAGCAGSCHRVRRRPGGARRWRCRSAPTADPRRVRGGRTSRAPSWPTAPASAPHTRRSGRVRRPRRDRTTSHLR